MSRFHRMESPLKFYHVTSRGNNKSFIFPTDDDKNFYINCAWKYISRFNLQLAAFCVMNNHVHMLVGCELNELPVFMQVVNDCYGQYYNTKYQHIGHVFEKRYFSSPITSEEYFIECIRYIHQNPVKAGICAVSEYNWSSYRNYLYHQGPVAWEKGALLIGDTNKYIGYMNEMNSEKYPFFETVDLHYSDDEAQEFMQKCLEDRHYDTIPCRNSPERTELIMYFHEKYISTRQISEFFSLDPSTIHRILKGK